MSEFFHISVLKNELTEGIYGKENGTYCDMTLGGGGHSHKLLSDLPNATLLENKLINN